MNVKKFLASTSRDAWRLVREALGPDAVILSNRVVNGQVEILAVAAEDMDSLTDSLAKGETHNTPAPKAKAAAPAFQRPAAAPAVPAAPAAVAAPATPSRPTPPARPAPLAAPATTQETTAAPAARATPVTPLPSSSEAATTATKSRSGLPAGTSMGSSGPRVWHRPERAVTPAAESPSAPATTTGKAPAETKEVPVIDIAAAMNEIRAELMGEIRSMRGHMEEQLTQIAWSTPHHGTPVKTHVLREMLAAGFSASLSRYLAEKVPAAEKTDTVMKWIRTVLGRNLSVLGNESQILDNGGIFALVGPTGVGKTTTTAKLAARCVMRHGAGKLALITTDGYRIGAYEQLRIYGKILGVMVHSVKDETDLRIALEELKGKHTILIDTVGMSQRDKMVAEQIAMLSGVGTKVNRLLCVSATSNAETLNEVVRSYLGGGLAGCIMTKLDEAATIGGLIDVVIRSKLDLYYVANGQRVPEDLHIANQHYLIDRAFKLKRETEPFQFQPAELPSVMANATRGMNDKGLKEVNVG